jgi:predicted AAA+ superfamily ATPase
LEIGRDTVVEYLKYLGDAKVFNLLYSDKKKMGKLSKQDKVNRCREEEIDHLLNLS